MKNLFIKYIMKEKKENIFHSSEYGKAQNAENMGVASTESFEERMKIEKNRQIMRGYNDSRVANGAYINGPRAKQYVAPEKKERIGKSSETRMAVQKTTSAPESTKRQFAPPVRPKFGA